MHFATQCINDICVWGTANHHTTLDLERDSSKQKVFRAISKDKIHDPFISMGIPSQVTLAQKCFPYGFCTSWKRIWMTYHPARWGTALLPHGCWNYTNTNCHQWWTDDAGTNNVWFRWPYRLPDNSACYRDTWSTHLNSVRFLWL